MLITKLLANPCDIGYFVKLIATKAICDEEGEFVRKSKDKVEFNKIPLSCAMDLISENQDNWLNWQIWGHIISKNRNYELVAESIIKEI